MRADHTQDTSSTRTEAIGTLTTLLICLLLLAATFVVYWGTLDNGFVVHYDDGDYVTDNAHVQGGLSPQAITWAFTTMRSANWHPLTWISHMADFALYRLTPSGHHLTNLLLHAANVLLLFLVLMRMTRSTWKSAFVAALFAVHPLHVESVAWIAERKDVLSAFFWMLTMWAYARYAERPTGSRYLPVVLFFALGLMSKPMLVTLPFALLVLDYWPLGRLALGKPKRDTSHVRKLVWEKAPLFALSAASCIVTYIAQQRGGALHSLQELSVGARVSSALVAYVSYIGKMLWPTNLSVMYPHPLESLATWQIAGSALLLACVTLLVFTAGRRRPYLPVGWLWYLITLVPVIGLVQVGAQGMADRYTYIPLIGLFIMIAWGAAELLVGEETPAPTLTPPRSHTPTLAQVAVGASSLVIVAALMIRASDEVRYWRDSVTLFQHAVAVTQDNYDAQDLLGLALAGQGRYREAIAHYRESLRVAPTFAPAHNDLAVALANLGKVDEGVFHWREAIRIDPDLAAAHINLGKALALKGKLDEAIYEYSVSLRLEPDNAEGHNNLGNAYLKQGRSSEAMKEYNAALRIDPHLAEARANLEAAQGSEGNDARVIAMSNEHYNAGVTFQTRDRTDEAIHEYRQAIRIRPDFAQAHNNLALAYFDKGNFAGAWKEVHLCRKHGLEPHREFISALAERMPDPQP